MPLTAIRADITTIQCDAVVNPTNSELKPGGGVDKAIDKAAGVNLYSARRKISPLKTGEAKITPGFNLPAKYIIHTVGPVWQDGESGEIELLKKCYKNVLKVAKENNCFKIAIPLISTGTFGFPKPVSYNAAMSVISEFLLENEQFNIFLVAYDDNSFKCSKALFNDVKDYLKDDFKFLRNINEEREMLLRKERSMLRLEKIFELADLGVTFQDKVNEYIIKKNMTDPECYNRGHITRSNWCKVIMNKEKKITKNFAIKTAIGLKLTLKQAEELLAIAGFTFSLSNERDRIIEYFFKNKIYDVDAINDLLAQYECEFLT